MPKTLTTAFPEWSARIALALIALLALLLLTGSPADARQRSHRIGLSPRVKAKPAQQRRWRRTARVNPTRVKVAHSMAIASVKSSSGRGVLPLISAGFENGLSNWNIAGVGEMVPTIESSDVRSGSHAAQVVLSGSQDRSELSLGGSGTDSDGNMVHFGEGAEYWYGFSFNIQQMVWGHPGAHNLIMQFKSEGEGSPEFGLQLWDYAGDGGHGGGKGLWSHSNPDSQAPGGDRFLAPVSEDEWHDVAIHFKASSQHGGFYEIFLDGQLVESRSNVTMIVPGHSFAYIKDGLYRNGGTIPGTSELLLDDAKLGTSSASVQPS